ncbi:DUF21 domain-containing protein [Chitinophaga horti]|uniref:DUF21 domain-containing protein n=1 Tax=Chitinophaga horti TaxID=2920382 RepID=A0ABY6J497_9BACT|nr:DUF21 domain-containing protein [Chitinophaga horti]UYQ93009.1 DUF21 domain-containing protein [Chitinophaga horti]
MAYHPASITFTETILLQELATPTPNLVVFLLVIFVLLLLSFIVSGAEVAFFSLNYKDLNVLKTRQNQSGKLITKLLEKPKSLLASLQISNILLNIAFIFITNYLINQMEALQSLQVLSAVVRIALITIVLLFLDRYFRAYGRLRTISVLRLTSPGS